MKVKEGRKEGATKVKEGRKVDEGEGRKGQTVKERKKGGRKVKVTWK